jgi:hypothetical protein
MSGNKIAPIEGKVVLVHILREFEVFTPQRCEDVRLEYAITACPYPQIILGFKPRRN